ncbi:MAG: type II toxin-antitoxin system HicA family toxin [Vicinamibacterales bacterium]
MKRREFERHLREHGCFLHHAGGSHDIWVNPANGAQAPVPRHGTLKRGTVRGICQRLGIPHPL